MKYIRNLLHVPVAFSIQEPKKRFALSPRGQRGDLSPIKDVEMDDESFLLNKGSLFELISEAEMNKVVEGQTTNQQKPHAAMDILRNPLDQPYEGELIIEEEYETQGKVVAKVEAPQEGDHQSRVTIDRAPEVVQVPGSQGDPAIDVPDSIPPEQIAHYVATQKNIEGPEAGLGGLSVTVDKPQKEKVITNE